MGRRRRPGGRNERIRRSVAEAVLDLLREGEAQFGVADVAERAGVHRATVYRRWPSRAQLLREALTVHTENVRIPDTGRWEQDVRALCSELARVFSDPLEIAMNRGMASGDDPELSAVLIEHWVPLYRQMATFVSKAIDRGDLRPGTDPSLVLDMLTGPLLMRTTLFGTRPTAKEVRSLADAVIRSFAVAANRLMQ
jgi:AcrR family transcriptional regulator